MKNESKILVRKPAREVFEAFVDPEKIGGFWFTSSSERWAASKTITLYYAEYEAEGDIQVVDIRDNEKIVYEWGEGDEHHRVTITFDEQTPGNTVVGVVEEGFDENDPELIPKLVDNKEGWIYALTCLKGYLEFGITELRAALVK